MKQEKNKATGETFREIVRAFFRSHGIKSPSGYLAQRGGVLYGSMYFLYKQADCGVGLDREMLDPKVACWFLQEAEDILKEDEIFEANPIEKFLRPRIDKFYKEQERKKDNKNKKIVDDRKGLKSLDTISLTRLRDMSCELGMELAYYNDNSIEKITHENFDRDRKIGLAHNGELLLSPIKVRVLARKMERAILRKCRIDHRKDNDAK